MYTAKTQLLTFLFLLLGGLYPLVGQAPQELTATQVLKTVDTKMFPDARTELMLYTSEKGELVDEQKLTAMARNRNQLILVRFTAPSELVGRDLLFRGRDVWYHDPSTQREIRIPASETYGASNFSYGDVVRLNYSDNYIPQILQHSERGWTLELTGKDRDAPYHRILLEVSPEFTLLRGICYSRSGEVIKNMQWSDIRTMGGEKKPVRLVVASPLEPEKLSIMITVKEELKTYPENIFNLRNLGARLEEKE